ncbi:MAG: D-alanine--D-alanine ligase [Thermoleophilia bacterium]
MSEVKIKKTRVGVLMGGFSREREISLRSGQNCLQAIQELGYEAVGIDVDRSVAETLRREKIGFAFLALHGKYGEDGSIQGLLEMMQIPYTGSRVLASALGMNKVRTKQIASFQGIPTAPFESFSNKQDIGEIVLKAKQRLKFPVMIKPCEEGSSLGVSKVDNPDDFDAAIAKASRDFGEVMAEEFIEGDEVTVGLLETRRSLTALPVLQLKPKTDFYDFEAKYSHGMTEFVVPALIPDETAVLVQEQAMKVHAIIGCRGFSRVDFIIDSSGIPQLTEINTLPGMTDTSDFPAQAKAAGISYTDLVQKMLRSAMLP